MVETIQDRTDVAEQQIPALISASTNTEPMQPDRSDEPASTVIIENSGTNRPSRDNKALWEEFWAFLKVSVFIWIITDWKFKRGAWGKVAVKYAIRAVIAFYVIVMCFAGLAKFHAQLIRGLHLLGLQGPSDTTASRVTFITTGPHKSIVKGTSVDVEPMAWPRKNTVLYDEPIGAIISMNDATRYQRKLAVDGVRCDPEKDILTWTETEFSYLPRSGYWMPGKHVIRADYTRDCMTTRCEYEFWVQWDIFYAAGMTLANNFGDSTNANSRSLYGLTLAKAAGT